jgi:N-acetylglucosamine kinase-like BadF-type ATPase
VNKSELKSAKSESKSAGGGVIIGLDCGGTSCRCQIAAENGVVIGRGVGGPGNYHVAGTDKTTDSIQIAIQTALEQAQRIMDFSKCRLLSLCAGVAGAGRKEDIPIVTAFIRAALTGAFGNSAINIEQAKVNITTDAAIALAGGTLGQPGVLVIAGTGSIAYGINEKWENARAGGWGPLISDQGSGYDIGCQALRAIVRAEDGMGPATPLKTVIMEKLGISQLGEVIGVVNRENSRSQIASLARVVLLEATKEDGVARKIVRDAANNLQELAVSVLRKLHMEREQTTVITAGGLFSEENILYLFLVEALADFKVTVKLPVLPPVGGALLLAYQEIYPQGSLTELIDSAKEVK